MSARFDQVGFALAVRAVIAARGVSDREVAGEAGVSPSTITRAIRQDKRPDLDGLAKLLDWARLPADLFIVRDHEVLDGFGAEIEAALRAGREVERAYGALRDRIRGAS